MFFFFITVEINQHNINIRVNSVLRVIDRERINLITFDNPGFYLYLKFPKT